MKVHAISIALVFAQLAATGLHAQAKRSVETRDSLSARAIADGRRVAGETPLGPASGAGILGGLAIGFFTPFAFAAQNKTYPVGGLLAGIGLVIAGSSQSMRAVTAPSGLSSDSTYNSAFRAAYEMEMRQRVGRRMFAGFAVGLVAALLTFLAAIPRT
jgi:hypothetical protein